MATTSYARSKPRSNGAALGAIASPTNRYANTGAMQSSGVSLGVAGPGSSGTRLPDITPDQAKEIEDAFRTFDLDQDDHLHVHELKVAMRALGFDMKLPDAHHLIKTHGSNNLLGFTQFKNIMESKMRNRDPEDEVRRAFMLFDEDGDGKISTMDLHKVAKELNEAIDEGELMAMVEEFDLDGDGHINFEEFKHIMMDEH